MNVTLFGPLHVSDDSRSLRGNDFGGAKPRGLLELLLLARGRTMSKDELAETLWADSQPRNVAATLEHYVCVLRHRLFDDQARSRRVIVTTRGAYRFDATDVRLDLDVFDRLLLEAEYADECARRELLREAVMLARSDLLDDAPFAPWAQLERDRYRGQVARAHLWLARDAVLGGQFAGGVRHGEQALRFAPYSEEAFRTIMIADHALGHDDLARSAYTRCRQTLGAELGVDPTTETECVASAIDAGVATGDLIAAFADRALSSLMALPRSA
jgi:DNA-binding SARP family transcriptional activator